MALKVLGNRVLLRPEIEETVTKSGIIMTTNTQPSIRDKAEVLAVGDGAVGILEVGDTVLFNAHACTEVSDNGEDMLITIVDQIIAVVL